MKWFITALVLFIGFFSPLVKADAFHPSRVRLLAHGSYQFSNELGASAHLVFPNLRNGAVPNMYMELNWKPIQDLIISPCVGWAFKADEVIVSLRLTPVIGDFYGWLDFETQPQSRAFYWFIQVQYKVTEWFHIGAEEESWGDDFRKFKAVSHGGGPNILFRFKFVGLDLALHARRLNDVAKPEFFLRFHLFL